MPPTLLTSSQLDQMPLDPRRCHAAPAHPLAQRMPWKKARAMQRRQPLPTTDCASRARWAPAADGPGSRTHRTAPAPGAHRRRSAAHTAPVSAGAAPPPRWLAACLRAAAAAAVVFNSRCQSSCRGEQAAAPGTLSHGISARRQTPKTTPGLQTPPHTHPAYTQTHQATTSTPTLHRNAHPDTIHTPD